MLLACDKKKILHEVMRQRPEMISMSTYIYQHPEVGFTENKAVNLLMNYLKQQEFTVEKKYGLLDTAFKASYTYGVGGPVIGLLCEYDALQSLGHACGHHLQGPCIVGAALAVKRMMKGKPYTLAVIGTPGEETSIGGKNIMLKNGAFKELDVAFMMHASDSTTTDVRAMARSEYEITFSGISSHAAIAPEKGRSALEAVILTCNGLAFLRNHVRDDVRINEIVKEGGKVTNVILDKAVARVELRSYDSIYLKTVIERFINILEGAALMTGTRYTMENVGESYCKVPVLALNELLMSNANYVKSPNIAPPREKTGSTDFASVMFFVPGACIRVAFIDKGVTAHSQAWLENGLSDRAQEAIMTGAQILALTCGEIIENDGLLQKIKDEFNSRKSLMG